jgi:hypothetical protein
VSERRLSSRLTIVRKVIIPAIWLIGLGYGVVQLALDHDPMALAAFLGLGLGLVIFRQFWFPLRTVRAAEDALVISARPEDIQIPYSQIAEVRQHDWLGVTEVVFSSPSPLGKSITYAPYAYKWFPFTGTHPANAFLRSKARLDHA